MWQVTYQYFHWPEPGLVAEGAHGVDAERYEDDGEAERVDVGWNAERGTVQEAEYTESPDHPQYGGHLHKMLLGEVVARVQLEYQNVVHSRRAPPVDVHSDEEEKLDYQKRPSVEFESGGQAGDTPLVEYSWKKHVQTSAEFDEDSCDQWWEG